MIFGVGTRWVTAAGCGAALVFIAEAQRGAKYDMASPAASVSTSPDAVCAGCHRTIYQHYQTTPMARASGPAMDGLIEGSFTHAASGVHYKVFDREGTGWLSYARPETAAGGYLSGEVKLAYFLGSNTR